MKPSQRCRMTIGGLPPSTPALTTITTGRIWSSAARGLPPRCATLSRTQRCSDCPKSAAWTNGSTARTLWPTSPVVGGGWPPSSGWRTHRCDPQCSADRIDRTDRPSRRGGLTSSLINRCRTPAPRGYRWAANPDSAEEIHRGRILPPATSESVRAGRRQERPAVQGVLRPPLISVARYRYLVLPCTSTQRHRVEGGPPWAIR